VLAFPAAVQVAADRATLYIADTNHNRILVCEAAGQVQRVIGSGTAGLLDGAAERAMFHHPHGLALDGDSLYVADTGNHALRQVDLATGAVTTLAGTGAKASTYGSGGPALETDLNSPWDVALHDGVLYVAMAGNHQLWVHALGSDEMRRYAGTGHEGKRDGRSTAAWLAQPSAIDVVGDGLIFADAETSSVRTCDFIANDNGMVVTVVGKDLFDWGDVNGPLDGALLQHTAGVTGGAAALYVADTYNNKVKRIDVARNEIMTLAGDNEAGCADGDGLAARFFEPHGLALADGTLYVADTNNHLIRRIDLATGVVTTIEVRE
jgi:DNA-binding beta-propeller fold protein YncE